MIDPAIFKYVKTTTRYSPRHDEEAGDEYFGLGGDETSRHSVTGEIRQHVAMGKYMSITTTGDGKYTDFKLVLKRGSGRYVWYTGNYVTRYCRMRYRDVIPQHVGKYIANSYGLVSRNQDDEGNTREVRQRRDEGYSYDGAPGYDNTYEWTVQIPAGTQHMVPLSYSKDEEDESESITYNLTSSGAQGSAQWFRPPFFCGK